MVVSGRRHSILDTVAVVAAASGRRRRLPADLLSVAAGVPDLLRVLVLVEILRVVAVAVLRWLQLR